MRKMSAKASKYGLARVLSKLGVCSRTQAAAMVAAGRVSVNGRVQRNPEFPTQLNQDLVAVDGAVVRTATRVYLALNKPRGLVVTAADEKGRDTVYALLESAGLPWVAPVGRLDKASEGLLLMSNDPEWAAAITDASRKLPKVYHVQLSACPDESALAAMLRGVEIDGQWLSAAGVRLLRTGHKYAWVEIVLDQGRNRHIRRLLEALGFGVRRLLRVAVGSVTLGDLGKGAWRHLSDQEVRALSRDRRE
jgi:23S rRNA pseudouridine2605 synthase